MRVLDGGIIIAVVGALVIIVGICVKQILKDDKLGTELIKDGEKIESIE